MHKAAAAVLAAGLMTVTLALGTLPARSSDTVTFDDTARFLAGMPPSANSPLATLAKDPAWQQHARYFDAIFGREENRNLSKIRAFSKEHLPEKHDTMLYMFSGPDFLYANALFPTASTYVLAGLEPGGDIPLLTSLSQPVIDASLRNLEVSTNSLLNLSFFITKNMKTQLHEGPIYGTLPVLLVFMARSGKTIADVSIVSLDDHGNVQNADDAGASGANAKKYIKGTARGAAPGVKIVFSEGSGPKQTLYYFSTNLADGSFERSGFMAFMDKLGPADSFIKSASYLLHSGGFDKVRSFLLGHSATIVQDDSGIPIAYFDPNKWRLQPFGRYVGPLNIFGRSFQPGMTALFQHAAPIDFGLGYRWRKNESNLLVAEKNPPATSDRELTPGLPNDQYPAGSEPAKKPKLRRKQVENSSTGALGCRVAGIFPFCSDPAPKPGR
jgi:hypothetical protein